ncbi:uncharacterized protein LOC126242840 [Schistocerca nitens]|uniref:uncharacterized protein LOC126242840 n=1 Tax=Schistocerca nitens TaxID=7011 RepID=UPI0021181088|nr:uncharacterized protein LOC126242840 [Schistocerca nitens]
MPQFPPRSQVRGRIRICQVNIEGYTRTKGDILTKLLTEEKIDVLTLQETHLSEENISRLLIPGYEIVGYKAHNKHGIATLIKKELVDNIEETMHHEFAVGIKLNDMTVYNVYKPPSEKWEQPVLPNPQHPAVIIGDFNSHHPRWGYQSCDKGLMLADWADINNYTLIYDAKDTPTFCSGAWGTTSTPDLCFVSSGETGIALPSKRTVLSRIPRSQHRPVIIDLGIQIPVIKSPPIARWNLRKANWVKFKDTIENNVNRIPPIPENYDRFTKLIIKAAHNSIPRGARKEYIPCWTKECEQLLDEYNKTENPELGEQLIRAMDEERKQRWQKRME